MISRTAHLSACTVSVPFLCYLVLAGCNQSRQASRTPIPGESLPATITVQSSAFNHNQSIPRRYTSDGEDISPPLSWSGLPDQTAELALIMDDPDAPGAEPWVHWIIYKVPATAGGLPEGVPSSATVESPTGALQGKNSWGTVGHRGPAPPPGHGVHHYHFKLYALDTVLAIESGLDKSALLAAMSGHVLARGELVGTYQR